MSFPVRVPRSVQRTSNNVLTCTYAAEPVLEVAEIEPHMHRGSGARDQRHEVENTGHLNGTEWYSLGTRWHSLTLGGSWRPCPIRVLQS